MNILVIDDERELWKVQEWDYTPYETVMEHPVHYIKYARTYAEASELLIGKHSWDVVYLDHDLGESQPEVKTLTTIIEDMAHGGFLIDVGKFVIHSANPIGRKEMYSALYKFYNVEFARVEDLL